MLQRIFNRIESKRNSKNYFWKILVIFKDFSWKIKIFITNSLTILTNILIFPFCSLAKRAIIKKAMQKEKELDLLINFLKKESLIGLNNVLEIGTFKGGTFYLWCKLSNDNANIISIDIPNIAWREGYREKKTKKVLYNYGKDKQNIHILRKDSHKKSTKDTVKEILGEKKLDFLFIDGDHSYEGVKKDFEMYYGLVEKGGIIAFHDIRFHLSDPFCDVHVLWNKIKNNFRNYEFIEEDNEPWAGIGIIIK